MIAVPPDTPVTMPDVGPTAAMAVLLLSQVPPPASDSVVVKPAHTTAVPVMADGSEFTVKAEMPPAETLLTQPVAPLVIVLITTVVPPADPRPDVLNVPLVAPITSVAVFPVALLAPVRL